jgi:beta-lactamase superfamily II metal-dependent hydrolase
MTRAWRPALVLAIALWACSAAIPEQVKQVELTFLDVGQGDAILIRSPEGQLALVDAGSTFPAEALRRHGVRSLDLAVATHPHADHIGGMAGVLRALSPRSYLDNGVPHTTSTYSLVMSYLQRSDITYLQATDRRLELGTVTLHILPPPTQAANLNDQSVGIVVEYGDFKALLTGDAETTELEHFLQLGMPDVTVLKASHHGDRDGVSTAWLDATRPELVVVSCGRDNQYGHPDPEALTLYRDAADAVYRTDLHSDVTIRGAPDGSYQVETGRPVAGIGERTTRLGPDEVSVWVSPDDSGEHAVVRNHGSESLAVGDWTLCDSVRNCFRFPEATTIPAGDSVIVFTDSGPTEGRHFYMGAPRPVWNNGGDWAILWDTRGQVVARYEY